MPLSRLLAIIAIVLVAGAVSVWVASETDSMWSGLIPVALTAAVLIRLFRR